MISLPDVITDRGVLIGLHERLYPGSISVLFAHNDVIDIKRSGLFIKNRLSASHDPSEERVVAVHRGNIQIRQRPGGLRGIELHKFQFLRVRYHIKRGAFANISHILAEYDAFLASFQRSQKEPPQKISITCPSVLADCDLIGLITDFQKRYPQTYFEIYDTPEEIKGEPDLSYWFGTPACRDKSRLQPICSFHPVLAVAPSYIEKYGEPKEPEDILKTPVFFFYRPTGGEGTTLTFTKNGETRDVRIDPSLRSSAYLPLVPSALGGEGVLANINSFMVDNYLKTGDLKLILTDWKLPAVPIYQEVNPARERDPLISQFIEEVLTNVHGIIKDIPGFMGYEESPGGIF